MTHADPTLTELRDGAEDFINAVMTGDIAPLLRDLRGLLDRPVPYQLMPTGRARDGAILALRGGHIGGVEVSFQAQSPGLWAYDDPLPGGAGRALPHWPAATESWLIQCQTDIRVSDLQDGDALAGFVPAWLLRVLTRHGATSVMQTGRAPGRIDLAAWTNDAGRAELLYPVATLPPDGVSQYHLGLWQQEMGPEVHIRAVTDLSGFSMLASPEFSASSPASGVHPHDLLAAVNAA